ncbi:MAG: universal stress protein, partial [Candidatus Promineifilaceae bacterium]
MFEQILVPLDGSPLAEQALPIAQAIAGPNQTKLILFRVVPFFTVLAADPLLYEEMNRMGEDEAVAYLRGVRESLPPEIAAETACDTGSAADAILGFARDQGVDLIVMSSHGRSGVNRWVYGSIAERILSQAPCPTLIINSNQPPWTDTADALLVPLDGSELAEKALGPAKEIADRLGLTMHLLRVTTAESVRREAEVVLEKLSSLQSQEGDEAHTYLEE